MKLPVASSRFRWTGGRAGRFTTCDAPEDQAFSQAVLVEATCRLSTAVEPRNYLAAQVNHLSLGINVQPRHTIVDTRRGPGSVKRRRLDFVFGIWFAEIRVLACVDK